VGCGEGAFALRLAHEGFEVIGLDLAAASEHATGGVYRYEQVNLASESARAGFVHRHGGTFDAVVLLEVIEHVRDPWQTLEFCGALLRPAGILLLSTPNITSFFSRFRFITGGHFHQFEPADFSYGHINPMTPLMVTKVLDDTGFDLLEKGPGPPTPVVMWDSAIGSARGRVLHAASYLVAAALTPLMRGGDLDGWSLIFVARHRADGSKAGEGL
jgi:SAM-dependent methyltransferase